MPLSSPETVLIVGSGGREAALVDQYTKSPHVGKIIAIPGHDLMHLNAHGKEVETHTNLTNKSIDDIE
jgi:phosphoribosylamine-glycine ligase